MRTVRDYLSLPSSCFCPIESNIRKMTPPGVAVRRPLDAELGPPVSGGVCIWTLDSAIPAILLGETAPPQFSLPHLHDGRVWGSSQSKIQFQSQKKQVPDIVLCCFNFIPHPFPSVITLEDRFRTVGKKKNTSKTTGSGNLELPLPPHPAPLGPTLTDRVGKANSLRGRLLLRCLFSLFDPKPQKK